MLLPSILPIGFREKCYLKYFAKFSRKCQNYFKLFFLTYGNVDEYCTVLIFHDLIVIFFHNTFSVYNLMLNFHYLVYVFHCMIPVLYCMMDILFNEKCFFDYAISVFNHVINIFYHSSFCVAILYLTFL